MGQLIDIKTDTGSGFTGYLALPESKRAPAILLVQEIFGVNSHRHRGVNARLGR